MTTQPRAIALFALLQPVFHRHGWTVALYGSCLTAPQGRDVDLQAVPWRPRADRLAVEEALAGRKFVVVPGSVCIGAVADSCAYRSYDIVLDVSWVRVVW